MAEQPDQQLVTALTKEARRIHEDALYSYKGHYAAAHAWAMRHLWIGIPTTIVAAAAGVTAIADQTLIAAGLSLAVAVSSGVFTFLNPHEQAARHLKAGNAFKALRNDARIFCEVKSVATPVQQLEAMLDELNTRRASLSMDSPQIPPSAYQRAKKGIEAGEALYEVDHNANSPKPAKPDTTETRHSV